MNAVSQIRQQKDVRPLHITSDLYARMISAGAFGDKHVELVRGQLIEMAPAQRRHAELLTDVVVKLRAAYSRQDWLIFTDAIIGLTRDTVRAPDISIVRRCDDDGNELTGEDVVLAIEISHSTLREDLHRKRVDYATAGIANYWVVDVEGVKIHRFAYPSGGAYLETDENPFGTALSLPGIESSIKID